MIVQYLSQDEIDSSTAQEPINTENQGDLVFEEAHKAATPKQKFVYWLDVHINVVNVVDEPFLCSEPVYYINVDENEVKNKKLFTIKINDYDSGTSLSSENDFKGQILTGNAQGLFHMDGLSLFTGSSSRKLDRETRHQHELEIKIADSSSNSSSRFALCKVIVNVNDINDNRPIVNDIELVVYNKLDSRIVDDLKVPIANAIAIDPDQIAKLTYSILSVKIVRGSDKRRKARDAVLEHDDLSTERSAHPILQEEDKELSKLFYMNSTNGYLYSTKTEMPCVDCTILISYRANDFGRFKTRVSRKSSIKLFVRKIPLSLFKISGEIGGEEESISLTHESDGSSHKTFDLELSNTSATRPSTVMLNINEDTKLGEKIYQIKTKSKLIAENALSITYFSLLDEGNTNQTFYLSNHDGALYLIKPLDYDEDLFGARFYNLTVLVTNWIGQIELVSVQVFVRDVNDNRPRFESIVYDLNHTIEMKPEAQGNTEISLMLAQDLDDLDRGKLAYKIEDCFYLGKSSLLLRKPYVPSIGTNPTTNHLNYPICSKQFVELVWGDESATKKNSQLVKLKVYTDILASYLRNSSDVFIRNASTSTISFHMDISVKDSSLLSSSVARVNLDLNLERVAQVESKSVLKRDSVKSFELSQAFTYGFKQSKYFIRIDSPKQLIKGAQFIRLFDEFVWAGQKFLKDNSSLSKKLLLNSFKPFSLTFFIKSKANRASGLAIEPNFGLVYLNQTLFDFGSASSALNDEFIFELDVYSKIKPSASIHEASASQSGAISLFKSARLVFSIARSVMDKQVHANELIYRPIWKPTQSAYFIHENVPMGSLILDAPDKGNPFTVASRIDSDILKQIQKYTLVQNQPLALVYSLQANNHSSLFELEPSSGFVRVRFEPDYEQRSFYDLNVVACLANVDSLFEYKANTLCFEQVASIRVNVINKNDNEPILKIANSNEFNLDLFNTTELIRAMHLFKFSVEDADGDLNAFSYKLIHTASRINHHGIHGHHNRHANNESSFGQTECNAYLDAITFNVDSFGLFTLDDEPKAAYLKLSDTGYENLVELAKNHPAHHKCVLEIELLCEVSDGLFSNRIRLGFNIHLSAASSLLAIKSSLIAPIFHTLELDESVERAQNERLANLGQLVLNHLSSKLVYDEIYDEVLDKLVQFRLVNYKDLFWINKTSNDLCLRKAAKLDRELRDTYELFIDTNVNDSSGSESLNEVASLIARSKHSIPSRIRVLAKLNDVNDNRPQFYHPVEARMSKIAAQHEPDLFSYNRTLTWADLLSSNEADPVLSVEASDADSGANAQISYSISSDLLEISSKTGRIYLKPSVDADAFWSKHKASRANDLVVSFDVTASDSGTPKLESILRIRLHFIEANNKSAGVYFKRTFYHFRIPESIELNKKFGAVDSIACFRNDSMPNIVYSIVDGDFYDQFQIDSRTGQLSARAELDYEEKQAYFLTVRAFDLEEEQQYTNATVRVDLIDVNDNEPQFDKFEYKIEISENLSKMSEIFRLNATDADSANSANSQIRYKLLNNLDKFYINELTGIVYNKITFDHEATKSDQEAKQPDQLYSSELYESSSSLPSNSIQLKIVAYDLGSLPVSLGSNQSYVGKSLESSCLLTINITNLNDNAPQFEKSVYFSQIEIDELDELELVSRSNNISILSLLLDNSTHRTSKGAFQFVTKVNAKDIDSDALVYSISKQSQLSSNEPSHAKQLAADNLFRIESQTGIVYVNVNEYALLKHFRSNENELTTFHLQLSVSDSMFSSSARLTVHIKPANSQINSPRPAFKSSLARVSLDYSKLAKSSPQFVPILDLGKQLDGGLTKQDYVFSINADAKSLINDLFMIELATNTLKANAPNLAKLVDRASRSYYVYSLGVTVCDRVQTGLCDQMIALVNLTDLTNQTSRPEQAESTSIGFAYDYWVVSVQQQLMSSSREKDKFYDMLEEESESGDEEYVVDENYESSERFYFEIKLDLGGATANNEEAYDKPSKSKPFKYEFELTSCSYSNLNVSYSNGSILKQIKQQMSQSARGPLRSLFTLSKHNGVLSSRKIINFMLPGVYSFGVRLSAINRTEPIDSMQFKLIILPPNSWLRNSSKPVYNYFKFDKEFYKFRASADSAAELGEIKLVNRYQNLKATSKLYNLNIVPKLSSSYRVKYRLVESKFELSEMFMLDEQTGALSLKSKNVSLERLKPHLNEDCELGVFALASVQIEANFLEYMCEMHIDFKALLYEKQAKTSKKVEAKDSNELIKFSQSEHRLRIYENQSPKTIIYRFAALLNANELDDLSSASIIYTFGETTPKDLLRYFDLSSNLGYLRVSSLSQDYLAKNSIESLALNISACVDVNEKTSCAFTTALIELIDTNDIAPRFEKTAYKGAIREDALPGTVVTTVRAVDDDFKRGSAQDPASRLEYFIMHGDELNQFAVSSDGKVYTRLLIDRERMSHYTLDIIAFDGKHKATAKLTVQVLDVDDNRPVCVDNYIAMSLSESLPIGHLLHAVNAYNLDGDDSRRLRYELVTAEQIDETSSNSSSFRNIREKGFFSQRLNAKSVDGSLFPFSISEQTGAIRLVHSFDYEYQKFYSFYARVGKSEDASHRADWLSSCFVKFRLAIKDENDNKPEFSSENHAVSIRENSSLRNVTRVLALDLDSKLNGAVRYSILTNQHLFGVDPKTGLVTLKASLDRELLGDWVNLTVRAADLGERAQLESDSILSVHILDENDNRPKFDAKEVFVSLQENSPVGFLITRVSATDPDLNSTTHYFIRNDSSQFLVNKLTGDVFVNAKLDYELKSQHVIEIGAVDPDLDDFDQANFDEASIKLVIDLLDVNDHEPQFDPSTPADVLVEENLALNSTIYEFKAFDGDSTHKNSHFKFRIDSDLFGIEEKTGRLFTKAVFDYESAHRHDYSLKVECFDNGEPTPLKTQHVLNIHVRDTNDNAPRFARANQTIIFRETFPLGQELTKLSVSDLDSANHGGSPFTFNIMEQYRSLSDSSAELVELTEPVFAINPNGSLILIKKPFSNQTYLAKVRCYDSGSPPLYADTHLTIKVTDESSNEPALNDTQIEILTIGGSDELDSDLLVRVEPDGLVGEVKAFDLDKQDSLFYDLHSHEGLFEVNSLSGLLKAKQELSESGSFELRASVTDKKFITEANLSINVKRLSRDCLANSLFVKFNMWPASGKSVSSSEDYDTVSNDELATISAQNELTIEKFISFGYLKRFKDSIDRLVSTQKWSKANESAKLEVVIISLKLSRAKAEEMYEQEMAGSLVELIFTVTRKNSTDSCLNGEAVSKMLNKRKSILAKKMKTLTNQLRLSQALASTVPFKLKIIDLIYNRECSSIKKGKQVSICTTNIALQHCRLQFSGYNEHSSMCEQLRPALNKCSLLPKHNWVCETTQTVLNSQKSNDTIIEMDILYETKTTTTEPAWVIIKKYLV